MVGVGARARVEAHLDELERLVDTAGGAVVARFVQERPAPDPATVVGSGFASMLAERCRELEVQTIVFDEDLTGSQVRNLERLVPESVKVLDRAAVILDIFAQRARSREAQTQVELAQLTYLLPRLTRRWGHLSRQAGGIGTRGVGETQLEIDRRLISGRIAALKRKLKEIERDRRVRRERRWDLPSIALVGYTNAGKSSLFVRLTSADVLVEDRLFATIDPRARRASLGDGLLTVVTDTVGFIRKLPHHLVAPFRSTLEEAIGADLVAHVVDAADPAAADHVRVGDEVLESLGVAPERVVVVYNKIDLIAAGEHDLRPADRPGARVSAATGEGLAELRALFARQLLSSPEVTVLLVPLARPLAVEAALGLPHRLAERYRDDRLELALRLDPARLATAGLAEYRVAAWGGPA